MPSHDLTLEEAGMHILESDDNVENISISGTRGRFSYDNKLVEVDLQSNRLSATIASNEDALRAMCDGDYSEVTSAMVYQGDTEELRMSDVSIMTEELLEYIESHSDRDYGMEVKKNRGSWGDYKKPLEPDE